MRSLPELPAGMSRREWGVCRWCSRPILDARGKVNLRRLWHSECADAYRILTNARALRRAVRRRDRKKCAVCQDLCNSTDRPWQVDHVVPVFLSGGRPGFFELENCQTLCTRHHRDKTAQDMKTYRQWRSGRPVTIKQGRVSSLMIISRKITIVYQEGAEERHQDLAADLKDYQPFLRDAK